MNHNQLITTISLVWSDAYAPHFRTEVPNLGYMYSKGYICLSEGVHLRLAIEEKYIFTYL